MPAMDFDWMDPVNTPWMVVDDEIPPMTELQWDRLLWDAQLGRLEETEFII